MTLLPALNLFDAGWQVEQEADSFLQFPDNSLAHLERIVTLQSLRDDVLHTSERILHFFDRRRLMELLCEFPESLAVPLVGGLDHTQEADLFCDGSQIEA